MASNGARPKPLVAAVAAAEAAAAIRLRASTSRASPAVEASAHSSRTCLARQQPAETHATVNIDLYTALLGGDIVIQVGASKLRLKVKAGTQPGSKVRVRGKGNGGTDLIVTFNVTLPTALNERQRQLVEELRRGG